MRRQMFLIVKRWTPQNVHAQESSWMASLNIQKGNVHTCLITAPMYLLFQLTLMAESGPSLSVLSCTVHSVCHLSLDYPRLTCPHNCCCCHTETWIHKVMLGKNWASGWHGQKQIARKYRAWARKCLRNHSLKHSLHLRPEDEVVLVQVMEYTINGFYRPWNL